MDEGVAIALVRLARDLPEVSASELVVTFNEVYSVHCGDGPAKLIEEVRLWFGAPRARAVGPALGDDVDLDMSSWEAAFTDQEREAEAALTTRLVALTLATQAFSQDDIDRILFGGEPRA